jgi:PBP1b-binding outer membrane lipoprotein LpoB
MKKLGARVILIVATTVVFAACASGPSPEQQTRESQEQREAERQQADFRKSLPPVSNPGQGW